MSRVLREEGDFCRTRSEEHLCTGQRQTGGDVNGQFTVGLAQTERD